ncbi:hypothetical protein F2P81_005447 [Scophthalmus maximus]|uniref:Anosmin-1-like n=1 Tax=Scophthalmus maximus TaxID=52904 RepID=A0A6A4T9N5_SCOMX|nr:hypothetical protein F2P81_005447 [Scophthalmus maximus]
MRLFVASERRLESSLFGRRRPAVLRRERETDRGKDLQLSRDPGVDSSSRYFDGKTSFMYVAVLIRTLVSGCGKDGAYMCDVDGVDEDVELEGIDGSCNSSDADNKMKIVMLNMVLEVRTHLHGARGNKQEHYHDDKVSNDNYDEDYDEVGGDDALICRVMTRVDAADDDADDQDYRDDFNGNSAWQAALAPVVGVSARRGELLRALLALRLRCRWFSYSELIGSPERESEQQRRRAKKRLHFFFSPPSNSRLLFTFLSIRFVSSLFHHASARGRPGAPVRRAAGGGSRPQEFAGAGGRAGADPRRQMRVQVPQSARDAAHRRLQTRAASFRPLHPLKSECYSRAVIGVDPAAISAMWKSFSASVSHFVAAALSPPPENGRFASALNVKTERDNSASSKQTECVTSREFLVSLRSSRQGDCPPPQRATGFAAACVESCASDQHCPTPRKCCSNGCGHTCQAPANLYKGVPLKPRREMSFVEDSEGGLKVVWVSKFNVSVEPVIYMLQSRWNVGIHPSEDHATLWTTAAMTLSEDVVLSDLRPQRWYQFRVAAINSHGSRGFTTPSKHYISSKDPSPPEPPVNIRVSNQTLDWTSSQPESHFAERTRGPGAMVAVLLRWEPPREGDLPVHNYRVTWTSRHTQTAHKHSHALHGRTHTVYNNKHTRPTHRHAPEQGKKESNSRVTQGAQCELWLQGLLPATSYFLSVQTVAFWGQKRLKSPRAQTDFTTISLAVNCHFNESILLSTEKGEDFSNELPSSSLPSSPSLSSSSPSSSDLPVSSSHPHPESPRNPVTPDNLRLEVAAPHYHDNQLQVKVFWKWPHQSRQRHPGPYILLWHPHTCSTNVTSTERTTTVQGTHHTITGLLFACKYRVAVAMKGDPGSEAVAWVTTPTCSSIRVRGGKVLPCNTEERLLAGRKVVLRPERLTADFQHVNGTLLTTFRWRMSQHALDPAAVEGFQFTWTIQSGVTTATEGQEDTLISQTQTIAPSQRSVTVHGLQADSVYQLHLQLLTAGGSNGAAVSKTIHTPAINATLR